ncbi:MAG: radical SAM protein [Chloroflexi bacterium]|nr:radical SAM protein [Chloroflexota bacterium]
MASRTASSWPAYLAAYESGLLREKVAQALELLGQRVDDGERPTCLVCPRQCRVARLDDEPGYCRVGRYAAVSSHFPHFGEEDCLRGWRGSGTVFFTSCNLRCVFCQNWEVSQAREGHTVTPERLADIYLQLQEWGCHHLNWVTPEHVVPQALEALYLAVQRGLRLPVVYNTSAYDAPECLALLDAVVDIYMPDFKFWDAELARRYVGARDYPERVRHSIREMHRQVGDLAIDPETRLARRGLLVRHLVMPGFLDDSREIFRWLASEISPDTYVNVMDQYHPDGAVLRSEKYAELRRLLRPDEHRQALALAGEAGLQRIDERRPHPRLALRVAWGPG